MSHPIVFISYSQKDEAEKNKLLSHLSVLQQAGLIQLWSDDKIRPGSDWRAEIGQAIAQTRVAILLITANFLNSDVILNEQIPVLLQRQKQEGMVIFPVIAKACAWQTVDWLAQMEVRPKYGDPVWRAEGKYADEELATIAQKVALIVDEKSEVSRTTREKEFSKNPDFAHKTNQSQIFPIINRLLLSLNFACFIFFILVNFTSFADAVIAAVVVVSSLIIHLFPFIKDIHKEIWFSSRLTSLFLLISLLVIAGVTGYTVINSSQDLRVSRVDNQGDSTNCGVRCTVIIEGKGITQLAPGERLAVYGPQARLVSGEWSEDPIAVLGVVQTGQKTVVAQLLLVHEVSAQDASKRIISGLKTTRITDLNRDYLLPAFGDGYLLGNDVIRLQPGVSVQVDDTFVVLKPQLQGNRIIDHLMGETYFRIIGLGEERLVAKVELVSGTIPPEGTLVQLKLANSSSYIEPDMVFIPGGTFIMGSEYGDDDEKPQKSVTIDDFYIAKTEIINEQFSLFINDGGYDTPTYWISSGNAWRVGNKVLGPKYWHNPLYNQPQQPVVGVSWYEAIAYANWLSEQTGQIYRLPSEAEWELTCAGGSNRVYPWGDTWNGEAANFADQSYTNAFNHQWADKTVDDGYTYSAPVGSYLSGATSDGVLDLAGNVWEWTSTLYFSYPYSTSDGRENITNDNQRVTRGGGWGSRAEQLRCANRTEEKPDYANYNLGFRLTRIAK